MRRIITALQVVHLLVFAYMISYTSAAKVTLTIVFAAVMLILILIGFFATNAAEKRLKNRITELLRELSVASSRIGSVSQEIGITIGESNASSSALFNDTQQMSALTADVTENLADMIAQLRGMISFSEEAQATAVTMERTSKNSFESIENGMTEIMHIVDTMKDIKITSGKASDSIEKLKAASGDVRTIIDKINDISMQMRIISINASVEASRAGRFGDGFAVVAREFQSLSNLTDTSMRDISVLVEAIQKDIVDVYTVVKENSGRVDDGVQLTKVVETSLKDIYASFSNVNSMVDKIGSILQQESRLAGDMGNRIENVESLIDQTNGNVKRVFESASNQKRGIENIAEMGTMLKSASTELISIAGSSADELTEKLDEKTKNVCSAFFPVIEKELCNTADIMLNDQKLHENVLRYFMSGHKIVEAAWTNELNGRFICSIPEAGIANAAMRDWFSASLEGESYISPIYISGITKNRCVTLSMPYFDEYDEMTGIIGVDLNLDMLKSENRS